MKILEASYLFAILAGFILLVILNSCETIYERYLYIPTGKIVYERMSNEDKKIHHEAYVLTKKYGNCFQLSGFNQEYYWSYINNDDKNHIVKVTVNHKEQFVPIKSDSDNTIKLDIRDTDQSPSKNQDTIDYHKNINWIDNFDHKELSQAVNDVGFSGIRKLWFFTKDRNRIVGISLPIHLPNLLDGDGQGKSQFLDNMSEDILRYQLIDTLSLKEYGTLIERL